MNRVHECPLAPVVEQSFLENSRLEELGMSWIFEKIRAVDSEEMQSSSSRPYAIVVAGDVTS